VNPALSILTFAVAVGGFLDARADPVRRLAAPEPPAIVKALTATRSVPEVVVEVPSVPPVLVADKHVANPAPRPAPNVARHPLRLAPHAPIPAPRKPVEESDSLDGGSAQPNLFTPG